MAKNERSKPAFFGQMAISQWRNFDPRPWASEIRDEEVLQCARGAVFAFGPAMYAQDVVTGVKDLGKDVGKGTKKVAKGTEKAADAPKDAATATGTDKADKTTTPKRPLTRPPPRKVNGARQQQCPASVGMGHSCLLRIRDQHNCICRFFAGTVDATAVIRRERLLSP